MIHASAPPVSLATLRAHRPARITGFDLPPELKRRLLEMGLTTGTPLRVIRCAPLGDPIEVEVRGYRLSLRKQVARGIQVDCIS